MIQEKEEEHYSHHSTEDNDTHELVVDVLKICEYNSISCFKPLTFWIDEDLTPQIIFPTPELEHVYSNNEPI